MADLKFDISDLARIPQGARVKLTGVIDITTAETFRTSLLTLLQVGFRRIALDFAGIEFINSSGFVALVELSQQLQETGGIVVLARMRPEVSEICLSLGLDSFFGIADTIDEAVAYLDDSPAPAPTAGVGEGSQPANGPAVAAAAVPIQHDDTATFRVNDSGVGVTPVDLNDMALSPEDRAALGGATPANVRPPLPGMTRHVMMPATGLSNLDDDGDIPMVGTQKMPGSPSPMPMGMPTSDRRTGAGESSTGDRQSQDAVLSFLPEEGRLPRRVLTFVRQDPSGQALLNVGVSKAPARGSQKGVIVVGLDNPYITVMPRVPGYRITPDSRAVNVLNSGDEIVFSFTRLKPGEPDPNEGRPRLEILYGPFLLKSVPCPTPKQ